MKFDIILGTLFGDEGKGSTVNYRCGQVNNPLVVRFNGGHQVGHTVVIDGKRHIFSNFGSGTLKGVPTYWSRFCTVSPTGVLKEGNVLREMGIEPVVYYDANAMVTTPFDVMRNIADDSKLNHGTVGVGFGQTIQRNEDNFKLYVRDLKYPEVRDAKLNNIISKYYKFLFDPKDESKNEMTRKMYKDFIIACDNLVERYEIYDNLNEFQDKHIIFEGGQGIMLDMDYGFFPNVTRSNCTAKNAITLINEFGNAQNDITTYYVTRAYQTRHGNGHMTNEGLDTSYIEENPNETNVMGIQGEFRKTVLDLDLLKYAVECDMYENPNSKRHMVVSCLDQVPEYVPVTINGELKTCDWKYISKYCGLYSSLGSWSEEGIS